MPYKQHMTVEYDNQFEKVKELKWYPWVGNEYHKSKILIVGMSTYYVDGEEWSPEWRKFCDKDVCPNRVLVGDVIDGCDHKPFKVMAQTFIQHGADKEYADDTRIAFWKSVAFLNFCQHIVAGESGECKKVDESKIALENAIKIIEPELVLAWTTQLHDICSGDFRDGERFARPQPRIRDGSPPIVGVLHPSRWQQQRTRYADWMKFLRNESASKAQVKVLIDCLK